MSLERFVHLLRDDDHTLIRIGDLQVVRESIDRLRGLGAEEEALRTIEDSLSRIENTLALLLRLLDEQENARTE